MVLVDYERARQSQGFGLRIGLDELVLVFGLEADFRSTMGMVSVA